MATEQVLCGKCGNPIGREATFCPKCGEKVLWGQPVIESGRADDAAVQGSRSPVTWWQMQDTKGKILIATIAAVVALVFIGAVLGKGNKADPAPSQAFSACFYAQNAVKQRLKAPSSARFQTCDQVNVLQSGPDFAVSGYVDSQNSFGAVIRSTYLVGVTFDLTDKKWVIKSVTLSP